MKVLNTALLSACLVAAVGTAAAADDMKKSDTKMKKDMTMQECKDHIAMAKQHEMKQDDAMMKKDAMCADMMKSGKAAGETMVKK